ncbi:unnamed protein product [Symbiodinium sp. CCMP2592]|nr:unnamed protein product [Symbiodinium sp. CCMP2592]
MSTDQAMRSTGFVLVLSSEPRTYGLMVVVVGSMAICILFVVFTWKTGHEPVYGIVSLGLLAFFGLYLVPAIVIIGDKEKQDTARPLLVTRWIETAACAFMAYMFGKTSCGYTPASEVAGLVGLMSLNILLFGLLSLCFNQQTGEVTWSPCSAEGSKDLKCNSAQVQQNVVACGPADGLSSAGFEKFTGVAVKVEDIGDSNGAVAEALENRQTADDPPPAQRQKSKAKRKKMVIVKRKARKPPSQRSPEAKSSTSPDASVIGSDQTQDAFPGDVACEIPEA